MERTVINPLVEQAMPIKDLAKLLPGKPSYFTIREWVLEGRRNIYTRARVKMDSVQLPTGMASSMEAYQRFIAALNALE